jgi:hypothetical protein
LGVSRPRGCRPGSNLPTQQHYQTTSSNYHTISRIRPTSHKL